MTSRSVRALTDDTRERLVPILDKADITNLEILAQRAYDRLSERMLDEMG